MEDNFTFKDQPYFPSYGEISVLWNIEEQGIFTRLSFFKHTIYWSFLELLLTEQIQLFKNSG